MDLTGETIAMLAANEFEDIELEYPLLRLRELGAEIVLVPVREGLHPRPAMGDSDAKPVTGRFGTPMPPEVLSGYTVSTLAELTVEGIDCLLLPGGFSPDHLRTNDEVIAFIEAVDDAGKLVAAICHGPQLLVETDILAGKRATGVGPVRTDLANAGAELVDEDAVTDGNLVTGRDPDALPAFCAATAAALAGEQS